MTATPKLPKIVSSQPSTSSAKPMFGTSTSVSRMKIYLLDQYPTNNLGFSKIPKNMAVLRVFFEYLFQQEDLNNNPNPHTMATKTAVYNAAKETCELVKSVWRHHFGMNLIDGLKRVGGEVNPSSIMIIRDIKIIQKITKMFAEWRALEQLSRRTDRVTSTLLERKEAEFRNKLNIPLNILNINGEEIIREAGITYWKEEIQHLRNQLSPQQIGSCDGYDMRQKKRDDRKLLPELIQEAKAENEGKQESRTNPNYNTEDTNSPEKEKEVNDQEYNIRVDKVRRIDVMGPISRTADARFEYIY